MASVATTAAKAMKEAGQAEAILSVQDLKVHFDTRDGVVRAVEDVSFDLHRGETLCIVGESGCGKSVTAMSMLQLLPTPPARIVSGRILFEGRDLLTLPEHEIRKVRGNAVSMIFQEPMTSLNPVLTIGRQITESIVLHQGLSQRAADERAADMLNLVRIADPKQRLKEYPHQLSGGMRQRVMIAMALSCNPRVLIADEPTTALDVTIQAQILNLMMELKEDFGTAIILITHDLGVVAEMAQRVVVMYAGRKVEEAEAKELFARPMHPYTRGLMGSIPRLNKVAEAAERLRLQEIKGTVPSLLHEVPGCSFAPRCSHAVARCGSETPKLQDYRSAHRTACWEADRLEPFGDA